MDMMRGVYTGLKIPARAAATVIVANWESAMNPPEVFRLDLKSKTQIPLTNFNADRVAKVDWQPLRHFWFTSKAGKRIHNMIALPPNFDENKTYPLLVLMHGAQPTCGATTGTALELLRSRARLCSSADQLFRLDWLRRKFAQNVQGDPFAGPGNDQ
jgi:dipeptidyl aminopeptidase/acylaminoacyl peptidase